jgi:hypothetical protein
MADITVIYDLSTPGGTATFNNGTFGHGASDDFLYLTDITGLDGAPLRTPVFDRPVTDGGIVLPFYKGAREIVFTGAVIVQSSQADVDIREGRNDLEDDLLAKLDTIYQADGTLSWTPAGGSAKSLTVRNNVPVVYQYDSTFLFKTFTFGLIAANPNF